MKNSEVKEILQTSSIYIYIDCFDTLLYRKFSPKYAYYELANFLFSEFHVNENVFNSCEAFFVEGEIQLSKIAYNIFIHYEINKQIEFVDFYNRFYDAFIHAELTNTCLAPNAKLLLNELKKKNKKLYLLSDFYVGKDAIKSILTSAGLDVDSIFDDIFVSCDYGCDKNTGKLYDVIVKDKEKSLMIGDNKLCDFKVPQSKGINSFLVDSFKQKKKYINFNEKKEENDLRFLKQLLKKENVSCGANYTYMIACFCKKLYSKLNINDTVYFLSRDGYWLKHWFELYLNYNNQKHIKTEYLVTSRLAMLLANPNTPKLSADEFALAFKHHFERDDINSEQDFVRFLGFSTEEVKKYDDTIFDNYFHSRKFELLWNDDSFKKIFIKRNNESRQKFLSYLDLSKKHIITVDVGWRGTAQNDMKDVLGNNIDLTCYYIGLYSCVGERECSYKIGLLFDYDLTFNRLMQAYINSIEAIIKTEFPQLICYTMADDIYVNDNNKDIYNNFSKPIIRDISNNLDELFAYDKTLFLNPTLLYEYFFKQFYKSSLLKITRFNFVYYEQIYNRKLNNKEKIKIFMIYFVDRHPKLKVCFRLFKRIYKKIFRK